MSRRSVLCAGAAFGAQLVVGIRPVAAARRDASTPVFTANAFVTIPPDGKVRLVMPAVEMGQGAYTSVAAMLAEELDVALSQVVLEHAPPDPRYVNPALGVQATGGSSTTMVWMLPVRRAGAAARAMLVQAAAQRWNVDPSTLRTDDGAVSDPRTGRVIRYGALTREAARLKPPDNPPLKDARAFKFIGQPVKRLDTPDKVTGATRYGIDVRLPGMKYATLQASPVVGGRVKHVRSAAATALRGVHQVVVLEDLVAVVATDTWTARQAMAALEIEWDAGGDTLARQDRLWAGLEAASHGAAVTARRTGDAASLLASGNGVVEASYELPFLAHAPMEPMNCTAHVAPGRCDVWVGTQAPGLAQAAAAQVLGLQPAQVSIHNHLIGGGFGRRLEVDGVIKAVRIAQKVDGPVKVTWTREEDIRQDVYRPMYHDRIRAVVEHGRVKAWHHRVTGPSILARWLPPAFKDGIDADAVEGAVQPVYDMPNVLVEYVRHETPVVTVGFWRGVGPNSTVFSAECFMDLLARKGGLDPLALRRGMLQGNPRALRVLDAVAAAAGWGRPMSAPSSARAGRGIALFAGFGSFLATVAEVEVSRDGDVHVRRIVCAADVGQVVNPDAVVAQIQGGSIFGLGTVLYSAITVARGRVQQSNFHDYRVPRMDDVPRIDVHLLPSTEQPGGIGEPPTVVVQPAIANAVYAATGVQLTRMPIDRRQLATRTSP